MTPDGIAAELDSIQRALRDIAHVTDRNVAQVFKGLLERQARIFRRLLEIERALEERKK